MYSSEDGIPGDFHPRSLWFPGPRRRRALVFTEMTDISPEGRITPCAGIYSDEQANAWKRIVDFVHDNTPAKMAIQIGHAGPKGSTKRMWDGIDPLESGNWPLIGPSAIPYSAENQIPREMTRERQIKADFVRACERSEQAGFDWLELHCTHGYLLSMFLTPLNNQRTMNTEVI